MKRLQKLVPVLLLVLLLIILFLSAGAQASDCAHEWSDWTGRDGQHRRECLLCTSVATDNCDYYSIVLRPACTQGGYTEKTCTVCGDHFITDETPANGHTWDEGSQTLAPTCVKDGSFVYNCLYCDEQKTETLAATGKHTPVNDAAVPATCAKEGLTEGAHCDVCGQVLIEQKAIAKTAHDWDLENTVINPQPTCLPGKETTTCKNCGALGQREVPAVEEHERNTLATYPATCTEDGYTQHVTCSKCNTVLLASEVIPATGHDWINVTEHKKVTCTTDGEYDQQCRNCDQIRTAVKVPATGHTYETVPAKSATCTQDGYTAAISCKNCEKVLVASVVAEALGHDYVLTSTRNPTCSSDGKKVYDCARCAASYSEKIDKLGHDLYIASTTEPTCTTMGLILQKCTRCNHTLSQSIKANGHKEVYETVAPTCTERGYTKVTCSQCDYNGQINPTAPVGHKGAVFETVAPTCTEGGYDKVRCSVCEAVYEENPTQAKGHTWASGRVVQPTCTQEGYTLFNCLYCSQTKQETPVAATGHTLLTAESNGNATHTGACSVCSLSVSGPCEGGVVSCLQDTVCAVCNAVYRSAVGEHSFTGYAAVDNSYHCLTCANCPETQGDAEKHNFTKGEFNAAIRAYSYSCRVCAHKVLGRPIGDANGDGTVGDAGDARSALRYSVGLEIPSDADAAAADVDRDGEITASDARQILRVSVGLEEENWSVLFVDENGNLPN